jgi:hypothetical protein
MTFETEEKDIYFSTYSPPTLIQFPIGLPERRNRQHGIILTCVSGTSAPPFQLLHRQRKICHQVIFKLIKQTEVSRVQVRAVRRVFKNFPL